MLESFWYECWSDIHLQLMYMLMLDTRVTLHDPLDNDNKLTFGYWSTFPLLIQCKASPIPQI